MKKLKIAVHLFGHLRTFEICSKPLFNHLLGLYDCDVFIHTWSELNHSTQTWHKNDDQYECFDVFKNQETLTKLYKAKKILIENQDCESLGEIICVDRPISIFGLRSMIYSMSQANQLRKIYEQETHAEYDFVLFTRPDILLKTDFKIDNFISKLSEEELIKCIFTASNSIGSTYSCKDANATDVLFFARPQVINHFFENQAVLKKMFNAGQTYQFGPEYYFLKTFEQLGFNVVLLKYCCGQDFEILRKKQGRFVTFRVNHKGVLFRIFDYKSVDCFFSLRLKIGNYPIDFCIGGGW